MSWQGSLVLNVDEGTFEQIKEAFRQANIEFAVTLREKLGSPHVLNIIGPRKLALELIVQLYDQLKDKMRGQLQLPDGTIELNDAGIQQIRTVKDSAIVAISGVGIEHKSFWEAFQPQIGELLTKLPDLLKWYPETSARQNFRVVLVMVTFLSIVTILTAYLAVVKVISGDAIVFLVGAIVGYVFAFLHRYLGVLTES